MGGGVFTRPGATATTPARARKGIYGNFVPRRARVGRARFLAPLQQYVVWPVQRPPFLPSTFRQFKTEATQCDIVSESNTDRIAVPRASIATLQALPFSWTETRLTL